MYTQTLTFYQERILQYWSHNKKGQLQNKNKRFTLVSTNDFTVNHF